MIKGLSSKKNIIRTFLLVSLIVFWFLWEPQSESTHIAQYIIIGNIILLVLLMEILPLWFSYQYRNIITLLEHFSKSYDEPLSYSYTPVIVIRWDIDNTNNITYLIEKNIQSDKSLFTIYHNNNLYEFKTDIIDQNNLTDLISVIIYYLQKDIPFEILYHHSKRIQHIL